MENKNINRIYDLWLEKATADPDLKKELLSIKGKDEEILDRFYRSLEFGTAGLRGVIGAGTNRMNYTPSAERRRDLRIFLTSILIIRQLLSATIHVSSRTIFQLKRQKLLPQTALRFIFTRSLNLRLAFHLQSGILKPQAVLFSLLLTTRQNITATNATMKTDIK